MAIMKECKEIHRDEIQDIFDLFDKGYGSTPDAQNEYLSRLMADYRVDRNHAKAELESHPGDVEAATRACAEHAKLVKTRLETEAVIPTRDTRSPPDVTPRTRVISVLGVDESSPSSQSACPSLGDGWMVSDFYMWMHVLQGMGKSQEWITSMPPEYLIEKYGREYRTKMSPIEDYEGSMKKPVQSKWSSGFVHGDPFEPRKVVLDDELLPLVQEKVTIGPKGKDLRDFFLQRLADIVTDAAASGDRVLIMIFAHGDYDTLGGLGIGINSGEGRRDPSRYMTPEHIKSTLLPFPHVKVTIYMTSCYSGHWVETTNFQAIDLQPVVLTAAEKEQESSGFVWSNSQRHAAGLFSSATIGEIVKETTSLPPDVDANTSQEYRKVTTAVVAELHRLCLPINITSRCGSSPVFTDNESHAKFWKRAGYSLDTYKRNYDRLQTIPASNPRGEFEAEFVDRNSPEILAWQKRHPGVPDEDYPEATGGYGATARGLLSFSSMNYIITMYFRSNPGFHTMEHRHLMHSIRAFYSKELDHDRTLTLRILLVGRLQANKQANKQANLVVRLLNLYRLPPIEEWALVDTYKEYDYHVFMEFSRQVASSGLFHLEPTSYGNRGFYYRKPSQYIASAMAIAGYNRSDVTAAIEKLSDARRGNLADHVGLAFLKSTQCSKLIADIRSILRTSWEESHHRQSHSALSSSSKVSH